MPQDNIRKFDFAAVDILRNLYNGHPSPMHGNELSGMTHALNVVWDAYKKSENPAEEVFDFVSVTDDTLLWLEKEGFVRFERMHGCRQPSNVQLTSAGFATIRKIESRWNRWRFWKKNTFSEYVDEMFERQDSGGIGKIVNLALDLLPKLAVGG